MTASIDQTPKNITVVEGENLALSAVVGGEPQPHVYWEKDNSAILTGLGASGTIQEHTYSILIPNSMSEDSGSYKVTAENFLGEDSSIIHVDVQGNFTTVTADRINLCNNQA